MLKKIAYLIMSPMKSVSVAALAIALAGGLAAQTAWADLPYMYMPADFKIIDQNKNGKIEKQEYLADMGVRFDRNAATGSLCNYVVEKHEYLADMGVRFDREAGNKGYVTGF